MSGVRGIISLFVDFLRGWEGIISSSFLGGWEASFLYLDHFDTDQRHCGWLSLHAGLHEVGHDVDRDWENDGAVVLRGDAVQRLQIPQLEKSYYMDNWGWSF